MRFSSKVDYRRADTPEERSAVFRLRYQDYLRAGAIQPNATEQFSDSLDDENNVFIFGVYISDKLTTSLRLHVASSASAALPAMNRFPDVLKPQIVANKTIVEFSRFVTGPEYQPAELLYLTLRLAWLAAEHFQADLLVTTTVGSEEVYQNMFGFIPVRTEHVPSVDRHITLMASDCRAFHAAVLERYPFFHSTHFERRMLFDRSLGASIAGRTAA
jgi:hypothetical protein